MFEGLFKPKFYTKCKSSVKVTKTRLEAVKRKKNSVCKYLKNDIADLLKNRLDYNAYGRIEGLLEEKKRLSCYGLLEQFCSCVGSNVSLLQKTSGCPEECREAISSLIFAAARVSEVPELRDLRHLFAHKYGSSLEQFVSQELVEKFKVEPPSKEMKLQVMHEIAREYSVEWNSKSLEQKLYTPPPAEHTEGNCGSAEDASVDTRQTKPKTKEETFEEKGSPMAKANGLSFHRRRSSIEEKNKFLCSEDESTETMESSVEASSVSTKSVVSEDEQESTTPFYYRIFTPPNIKPRIEKSETSPLEKPISDASSTDNAIESPVVGEKPKPRSVRRRFAKPPPDEDNGRSVKGLKDIAEDSLSLYPLKPPPASSASLRADSMEKAAATRRLSRRTISWQPAASNEVGCRSFELPDFDEVAARVDALRRK